MTEVNKAGGFSRAELIKLMDKNELSPAEREIILFNFDNADIGEQGVGTAGAGDKVLKGFEIEYFYKLMGWEQKENKQQGQEVRTVSPESVGAKHAEYNPQDKTTLVYDEEAKTITKYDEAGNVLGVTDFEGKPIKETKPVQKNKKPAQPEQKPLTQEEINTKVRALKPGEVFTYTESSRADWGSGRSYEKHTVQWKRNQDGTLSKFIPQFDISARKTFVLETKYADDMKTKISEDKLTRTSTPLGQKATIQYGADGNPVSATIPLKPNTKVKRMSFTREGFLTNAMSHGKFSSQEIRDKDGNVILKCVNGEFTDKKGSTVSADKAYDIIEDAFKNGNIKELVQNY